MKIQITKEQYLEIEKLSLGIFSPLDKFMNEDNFLSCIHSMTLTNGEVFPIPIIFDMNKSDIRAFEKASILECFYDGDHVADIEPESFYQPDKIESSKLIFGTNNPKHPGVSYYHSLKEFFISGNIILYKRPTFEFSSYEMTPTEVKESIKDKNWKTIAGFQTRNIPHRAHEYLQKVALEHVDGVFIQPIVGYKKKGDFKPEAIISSYQILIENYFPTNTALFSTLSTVMRYAGPREAIFHAIIRRNFGCTHFIIGRDHAGVGNYYEKYAAHNLANELEDKIGIKIMKLHGPYYCEICDAIVTEKTCPHMKINPQCCYSISGTKIRDSIINDQKISDKYLRSSVLENLKSFRNPFIL